MGRGRKGRGGGGGGGLEDQYGEAGHSQDRQEHMGMSRGGATAGGGGGEAGCTLASFLLLLSPFHTECPPRF